MVTLIGAVMVGVTGAGTTVTVVLADLVPSATLVAVMVTLPAMVGAVHAPVAGVMVPPVALQVMALLNAPVTVLLKVWLVLTVMVGLAGLMAVTATVCGVTVAVAVAVSPAALVTVRV